MKKIQQLKEVKIFVSSWREDSRYQALKRNSQNRDAKSIFRAVAPLYRGLFSSKYRSTSVCSRFDTQPKKAKKLSPNDRRKSNTQENGRFDTLPSDQGFQLIVIETWFLIRVISDSEFRTFTLEFCTSAPQTLAKCETDGAFQEEWRLVRRISGGPGGHVSNGISDIWRNKKMHNMLRKRHNIRHCPRETESRASREGGFHQSIESDRFYTLVRFLCP